MVVALVIASTQATAVRAQTPPTIPPGTALPPAVQAGLALGDIKLQSPDGQPVAIAGVQILPSHSFSCARQVPGTVKVATDHCLSLAFLLRLAPAAGVPGAGSASVPDLSRWNCGGGYTCIEDCDYQPVYDFGNQGPFEIFYANTCMTDYYNGVHVYGLNVTPNCNGTWPGWACSYAPPPTGYGNYWNPAVCVTTCGAMTAYGNYHYTYTICWPLVGCFQEDHADIDQRINVFPSGFEYIQNYGP
jgi:hypothetical protein